VDVAVGDRYPSEIPGFDLLHVVMSQGEKRRTTISCFQRWKQSGALAEDRRHSRSMTQIDLKGRACRNKEPRSPSSAFDDFECPYFSKMHQTLFPELAKTYGDRIRIIYKDNPLDQIIPGPPMPRSTPTAWRRRTTTRIGNSPTRSTTTRRRSMRPHQQSQVN